MCSMPTSGALMFASSMFNVFVYLPLLDKKSTQELSVLNSADEDALHR